MWSINVLNYKEIASLLNYQKSLFIEEIQLFSNKWNSLVEINSELRVLDEGKVKKNLQEKEKWHLYIQKSNFVHTFQKCEMVCGA